MSTFAAAAPSTSTTTGRTADEIPPFAIEDFSYPNASKVLADKGILLKRGDGHIVLAECGATTNQIKVLTVKDASVGRDELYCFQTTASTGHLTLELPRVFALETADHPISADLTANGETTTVEVAKDDFAPVGEGTVGGARSVLVEIRVTG
ncbi:hypothetical protein ACFYWP_23040 [Actinacidiphila glaucinigra]|uniref:hypothetical protein n=1 Tax=Actinacidiphila glaucinigra TaxID=235986 RepID=UPI0036B6F091